VSSISITNLLGGLLSLADFGADSTGNADSYPAFRAANASANGKGLIYVPPGTYRLASSFSPSAGVTVLLAPGVTLTGAGSLTAGSGGILDLRSGNLTVGGHLLGSGAAPSMAAGTDNGATPPDPVVDTGASDTRGGATFGSGTTPAAGQQVAVTFATAFAAAPVVVVIPRNAATQALGLYATSTVSGFSVSSASAPAGDQANTTYSFAYVCIG